VLSNVDLALTLPSKQSEIALAKDAATMWRIDHSSKVTKTMHNENGAPKSTRRD
jgi:hypothetical protein